MSLTLDEIKSKAPNGATHYYIDKDDGDVVYMAEDTYGRWCYVESDYFGYPCHSGDVEEIEGMVKPFN